MDAIITHATLGILAIAFTAWAGFVWRAAFAAEKMLGMVSMRVESVQNQITQVIIDLKEHEKLPSHGETATSLAVMKEEIHSIKEHLDLNGRK